MNANRLDEDSLLPSNSPRERAHDTALRRNLEPWVTHIVRLTLCRGPSNDPVSKRAWEEAQEIAAAAWQAGDNAPENLVRQVVQRMCATATSSSAGVTAAGQWAFDTVPNG